MRQFQRRRNVRRILGSPVVLMTLFFIVVILAYSTWGVYKKSRIIEMAVAESRDRLDLINFRKQTMEKEIGLYGTPRGVEEKLREKFQVAKPGEHVLVIVEDDTSTTSVSVVATSSPKGFSGYIDSFVAALEAIYQKKNK